MIAPPSMEFDLSIEDFREPNNPSIDRRFLRPLLFCPSPSLSFRFIGIRRLNDTSSLTPCLFFFFFPLPLFLPYDSMFALLCRVSPRYSNLARHLLYFFLFFPLFLSLWLTIRLPVFAAIIVANRRSLFSCFLSGETISISFFLRKTSKIFDLWNIYRQKFEGFFVYKNWYSRSNREYRSLLFLTFGV